MASPRARCTFESVTSTTEDGANRAMASVSREGTASQTSMSYGQPANLDEVMQHFPELRVCASPPGWPWVNELLAVAWRHPNVWIGLVAVRPKLLMKPDSGYGPLLQYGRTLLKNRMLFGSGFPMMPVARSVSEIEALPLDDAVRERWLHGNAAEFLRLV